MTDAAGNTSTSNVIEVVVDNSVPAAGTLSFSNLTDSGTANTPPVTTDNTFNLTLTGQESGAAVAYQASLNGGAFAATTASQSGLADGDYQFRALVTDAAGNTSTSNVIEVVVDNSVPAAGTLSFSNLTDSGTANTPPVTTDNTFNLTLTGQESGAAVAYQASLNGGAFAATTASQSGLADGDYQFRALVTDAAGNTSTSNVIEVVVDNSVPAAGTLSFSNLTDSGTANTPPVTTDNTFNLTLTGQESGAAVAYQASLNGGAFAATTASQSGLADGDYQFRALVTDAAGNTSTSNVIEVVVDNSVPAAGTLSFSNLTDSGTANTPPVTTDNTFNLTLTGQESGAAVAYQASLNGGAFAATTASQSGLADGDYQFRALVTDAAGNTSTSNVIEVVVDNSVPAAGTLSFSNLTDSGTANTPPVTTDNTFNLTLTGQESGAAVAYQASLNGGAFAATTASQSGLADGDYQFRALVTDAAGNTSTSNVIEVVVDNSAPAEALAITAIATDTGTAGDFITSDTTLIVSGSNGALAAGEKIQISSDGTNWFDVTPIDSTHWSYDDTATPHTSSFTYQARILDTAGNIGTTASQAITIDTTAPTITGDLGITVNNGSSVVLTTADFHAVDLDNPASQLTFSVTNPTHGYVAFVSAPGAPITSFTEADLEAGSVIFVHDGSATTEATFKVSVSDGALTSAPTTILASVPTVSIVVKTANGMNFQNEDTISALGAGVLQPGGTATTFTLVNVAANRDFVFQGTGFIWTGNILTAGTISVIHELAHDTQTPLVDFTGHIDAPSFYAAAVAQAAGNPSIFDALTSQWIMNFVGGGGNDAFGSNDANDFFKVSGGSDVFDGGFGFDRANYTNATGPIAVQLAVGTVDKRCNAQRYLAVD